MSHVVLSYGCPRAGTTWLARCLKALAGVGVYRLSDGIGLHPCRGKPDGLLQVNAVFYEHPVTWVRIRRHPLEIAASFVGLRTIAPHAARARDSDATVVKRIRFESWLSALQWDTLKDQSADWPPRYMVQIRYEDLADLGIRKAFAREVAANLPEPEKSYDRLLRALDSYGKKPAVVGRLGAGRRDLALSEDQEAWYREQLSDVIRAEGYR